MRFRTSLKTGVEVLHLGGQTWQSNAWPPEHWKGNKGRHSRLSFNVRPQVMHRHCSLLAVAALSACTEANPNARETPGEKTEWSVLQAAEFTGRQNLETKPSLRTFQGYDLLVVPSKAAKNIWILLNPKSPPYYKQLPAGQFTLEKTFVEQLARERKLGYTTELVLTSSIGNQ